LGPEDLEKKVNVRCLHSSNKAIDLTLGIQRLQINDFKSFCASDTQLRFQEMNGRRFRRDIKFLTRQTPRRLASYSSSLNPQKLTLKTLTESGVPFKSRKNDDFLLAVTPCPTGSNVFTVLERAVDLTAQIRVRPLQTPALKKETWELIRRPFFTLAERSSSVGSMASSGKVYKVRSGNEMQISLQFQHEVNKTHPQEGRSSRTA